MQPTTVLAGIGGIAFGVLMAVAAFLGSPLGGPYDASEAASFVGSGHRLAVFVSLYLAVIAVLGLICLLARLREAIGVAGDAQPTALGIFWGTALVATTALAAGWAVSFSVPIAYAVAGDGFSIGPAEAYAIGQVGDALLFGAGGILLGIALITLFVSARRTFPAWLGWLTLIAGVLGLASPAFFPFFALLIWGLIVGIWLLVSRGSLAQLRAADTVSQG
jgi:hypothetical protein